MMDDLIKSSQIEFKRPKRYWFTLLWVLPAALVSWVAVLFLWLLWGTKLHWMEGLWCEFKPHSWPCRSWYRAKRDGKPMRKRQELWREFGEWVTWAGTTFVWGGILAPGKAGDLAVIDTDTEYHEHIHIEQGEVAQVVSTVYAAFNLWRDFSVDGAIDSLIMWSTGAVVAYVSAAFQAWMRGETAYRENTMEESAYAQTAQRNTWLKK